MFSLWDPPQRRRGHRTWTDRRVSLGMSGLWPGKACHFGGCCLSPACSLRVLFVPTPSCLETTRTSARLLLTPGCEHLAVGMEAQVPCHRMDPGVLRFLDSPKLQMEGVGGDLNIYHPPFPCCSVGRGVLRNPRQVWTTVHHLCMCSFHHSSHYGETEAQGGEETCLCLFAGRDRPDATLAL